MFTITDIKNLFDKYKLLYLTAGGIYPAMLAAVSDFLKPLFNSTLFLVVFMTLLLLVEYLFWLLAKCSRKMAGINASLHRETGGKWFAPFFVASIMAYCIFIWTYALNGDAKNGYLAENFHVLSNLQADLGMTNRRLAEISEHTRQGAETLGKIDTKLDSLKKEKSANPRKELANIGIQWNEENYFKAIYNADMEALRLFWAGGMNPMATKETRHGYLNYVSRVPYVFFAINPHNPKWEKILNIYLANEFFDLNDKNFDYYSPPHNSLQEQILSQTNVNRLIELVAPKRTPAFLILNMTLRDMPRDNDIKNVTTALLAYDANLDDALSMWEQEAANFSEMLESGKITNPALYKNCVKAAAFDREVINTVKYLILESQNELKEEGVSARHY